MKRNSIHKIPLPIGYDDYKTVIEEGFCYVDKTLLIKELLDNHGVANLLLRPGSFGKSLNLSMLRYFFEKPVDGNDNRHLFENQKITQEDGSYTQHQGKYPVIMLSLKSGKQSTLKDALFMIRVEIAKEFKRHSYVESSLSIETDRKLFRSLLERTAPDEAWLDAIAFLSRCLNEYYKEKVIILIDEYDVPLENAYYSNFYDEMVSFIRSLFESALKTNLSLKFAMITGCLRISKESIFTGLNNLRVVSIMDTVYSEHFGFTQQDVDAMLEYYGLEEHASTMREWYDGYVFGMTEVYKPWSVINYVSTLYSNNKALPIEYWSNTSSNSIVKDLIVRADSEVRDELEMLIQGGTIKKVLHEELTYEDIYTSQENLWNFLYFTGYLKAVDVELVDVERVATLKIPNLEVKKIYSQQIVNWTRDNIKKRDWSALYQGILSGNADMIQAELSPVLMNSISYKDSYESFYHGLLVGLLMPMDEYKITSNQESGDGRYDICIVSRDGLAKPVILNFKVVKNRKDLETAADNALQQIMDNHYDAPLADEGYEECIHIGIGFCRKMCRVRCESVRL